MLFLSVNFWLIIKKCHPQETCEWHYTAIYGVPRGIRTPDLPVRSRTLYPAEPWARSVTWDTSVGHESYYSTLRFKIKVFF